MKFGFYTPDFGFCGDARVLAHLAREAEQPGWDGFFVWHHLQFVEPTVDPWMALTAMAMRTERIRPGTLVTAVPRRHIAKLAREVSTLDHVSGGRAILGIGAGFAGLPDYAGFGDETDARPSDAPFDVVEFGKTRDRSDTTAVAASEEAGATRWLESIHTWETTLEATRARLHQGPPRP